MHILFPTLENKNKIDGDSYYVTETGNYTKYLVERVDRFGEMCGRNVSIDRYFTTMSIVQ